MPVSYFASATVRSSPGAEFNASDSGRKAKGKRSAVASCSLSGRHSAPADPPSSSGLSLNRVAAEEYRIPGQPINQELHPFPFPHASVKKKAGSILRSQRSEVSPSADSESSYDSPEIGDDDQTEKVAKSKSSLNGGLRQQHYSVLTCILHRCLMEKDYMRASRAWGMLLRLEVHGHPLDIRLHGRWGIGAEILLHGGGSSDDTQLSVESLMKAKDYYERLILQYPYRKYTADNVSSLTFYPVMFGVWIYAVQLRYENTLQENVLDSHTARQAAVKEANEIVTKLSELLISPPYSDHSGLWKTQGMLYQWLSQLLHQSRTSDEDSLPSLDSDEGYRNDEEEKRQEALRKANAAFSQSMKLGGTIGTRILSNPGNQ
ncbi:MAG: hypothetical protein Q9213_008105 [Squamulea squamosa]